MGEKKTRESKDTEGLFQGEIVIKQLKNRGTNTLYKELAAWKFIQFL